MKKHIKYLYLPDFANKFLISNHYQVLQTFKDLELNLSYVFSTYKAYNPMIIKLIPALESLGITKGEYLNQRINFTFGKQRLVTKIYITINYKNPTFEFFLFCTKIPLGGQRLNSSQKAGGYFISPGFIPIFLFPGWERKPILSMNIPKHKKRMNLFNKTAYLD
jgi:hypothetical protein